MKTRLMNRELVKNIALMLVTALLCMILFEAGCWILNLEPLPVIPDAIYMNDDVLGYRFTPNFSGAVKLQDRGEVEVWTNSLGLWDDQEPPFRQPVILVLGDSLTFGAYCCTLGETYPKILQDSLAAKGRNYTVINAGVPGYGPKNEVEMLKKYYEIIKPQVVVLTFYVGNDIYNMVNTYQYKVVNGRLVNSDNYLRKTNTLPKKIFYETKEFVHRNSAGYRVVKSFLENTFFKKRSGTYTMLQDYTKNAGDIQSAEVDAAKKEYLEYKSFCDEKNITCMVYIVPSKMQLLKDNTAIAKEYGITEEMDYLWFQKEFIEFFNEEGIVYYDLTPSFMEWDDVNSLYLPLDIHWTQEGCLLTGEYLAEKLINEKRI